MKSIVTCQGISWSSLTLRCVCVDPRRKMTTIGAAVLLPAVLPELVVLPVAVAVVPVGVGCPDWAPASAQKGLGADAACAAPFSGLW